jgi:oligopeptide/dipeptide ABC transporter ATP-binding protein
MNALIKVRGISKHFPVTAGLLHHTIGTIKAVNNVSLDVRQGEILGVVGESGCGKSTLARLILRLIEPTSGNIFFKEKDIFQLDRLKLRQLRCKMQMVFQDPYSALDPRYTAFRSLAEVFKIQKVSITSLQIKDRITELLETVGLRYEQSHLYPHQLSGGQKQRVVIARALTLTPEFVVLDEPTAALDVSVQAQVILLLQQLREKFNLTYLFISHDLALVDYFCDRVVVMYLGNIVEILPAAKVSISPRHPYTKALSDSVFIADPHARKESVAIEGEVSSPFNLPPGCVFEKRCPLARLKCRETQPTLEEVAKDEYVACYYPLSKSNPDRN